jgi:hypothetical protein
MMPADMGRRANPQHPRDKQQEPRSMAQDPTSDVRPTAPATAPAVAASHPLLIDRREACRRVGVSLTTWKRWQRDGRIRFGGRSGGPPPAPHGGRRRYDPADVEQLAAEVRQLTEPYPDPARPGCFLVPLVGRLDEREAVIDAESAPAVAGYKWAWSERSSGFDGGIVHVSRSRGPAAALHRVVLGLPPGRRWRVTHANGDSLDCRRANLVVRTLSEQGGGARKLGSVSGRKCSSRFKGVSWAADGGKWVAQIHREGVRRYLGRFRDEIAAAAAYDEAAREVFGEHALLNFPDGVDAALARAAADANAGPAAAAAATPAGKRAAA